MIQWPSFPTSYILSVHRFTSMQQRHSSALTTHQRALRTLTPVYYKHEKSAPGERMPQIKIGSWVHSVVINNTWQRSTQSLRNEMVDINVQNIHFNQSERPLSIFICRTKRKIRNESLATNRPLTSTSPENLRRRCSSSSSSTAGIASRIVQLHLRLLLLRHFRRMAQNPQLPIQNYPSRR